MMTNSLPVTLTLAILMLAPAGLADDTGAADTGYHTFRGELRPHDVDNNVKDCGESSGAVGDTFHLRPDMAGRTWTLGTQDPDGTYRVTFFPGYVTLEGVHSGTVPEGATMVGICKSLDADAALDHGVRIATVDQAEHYLFQVDMESQDDVLEFRSTPDVIDPLARVNGCGVPAADRLPIHAAMRGAEWRLSGGMVLTFVDSEGGRTILSDRTRGIIPEDAQEVLICSPYYLTEFGLTITFTV